MFFDTILLNTQHGGRFGAAWIAATRGPRFVAKRKIKELDIVKLCMEIELFITSQSTSPKKRFSLRLASILVNGAVKIFREQAKMLQGELYMAITRVGSVMMWSDNTGILETPPTPVPKVKTKRGKKQVVETPDLKIGELEDIFLRLPNVEDILQPPARSEEICIREDLLTRHEQYDDFGFGILSRKEAEEELQSLLSKTRAAPSTIPQYPSSDSVTPQAPIEVIVQVHAPKGSPLGRAKTPERIPDSENGIHAPVTENRAEPLQPTKEREKSLVDSSTLAPAIGITEQPIESTHVPDIQHSEQTIQPQTEIQQTKEIEHETPTKKARKNKRKQLVEIQLEETPKIAKVPQEKIKLLVNKSRRMFVRINRCNENEGQFTDNKCPLPSPYKNIFNEYLYHMFWFDDEESIIQVRARSSMRSVSASDSVGLRQRDAKRSTMEKESISDVAIRPSVLSLEAQLPESTPLAAQLMTEDTILRQATAEELPEPIPPTVSFSTPRKRKRITTPEVERLTQPIIPQQISVPGELDVSEQPKIPELPVSDVQSVVPEKLTVMEEEVMPFTQAAPKPETMVHLDEEISTGSLHKKKKKAPLMATSDYKKRQQHIIDLVVHWVSDKQITIEDICEKPVNKLNIARAFSDLLTLTTNRFLILISEEGSLELKYIKKGSKLQKRILDVKQ